MSSDTEAPSLLLVRERDVGLFSMVLQVLHALHCVEDQRIDRLPVALFGRGLLYFQEDGYRKRRNAWEYYFEPLVAGHGEGPVLERLGERAFDLLESQRRALELARGAIEFPRNVHRLAPLSDQEQANLASLEARIAGRDWVSTESFLPTIDGRRPASFALERERGADLVRRYVRPRPYLRARADAFFEAQLAGRPVIGVHVRGTDGHSAPARGVEIPFERYFAEIEERISALGRDACRVFLATDEAAIVSIFESRFGSRLAYCDTVRKQEGDEVFGIGPTGQVMPGYITSGGATAVRNGEEAVIEYLLLTRSDVLVHNVSSLSMAARYSVPASVQV